jgi:hypothetical protein
VSLCALTPSWLKINTLKRQNLYQVQYAKLCISITKVYFSINPIMIFIRIIKIAECVSVYSTITTIISNMVNTCWIILQYYIDHYKIVTFFSNYVLMREVVKSFYLPYWDNVVQRYAFMSDVRCWKK